MNGGTILKTGAMEPISTAFSPRRRASIRSQINCFMLTMRSSSSDRPVAQTPARAPRATRFQRACCVILPAHVPSAASSRNKITAYGEGDL